MTRRTALRIQLIVFLAAQIATPGCLVVPKTVEHREFVRQEPTQREPVSPAQLVFSGAAELRRLTVRAWSRQQCRERRVFVYRHTKSKTLDTDMATPTRGNDLIAWLFIAPVTGTISLLISAPIVIFSGNSSEDEPRIDVRAVDCSRALASARVIAQLPSGRILEAATNAEGIATFDVPDDEGASGAVTVSLVDFDAPPFSIAFGPGAHTQLPPLPR